MPFPFAAAAAGVQAVSLLSRLFGKSAKQRKQEAVKDFTDRANVQRGKSLQSGVSRLSGFISGQTAAARNSAAQRASALGRSSDAEAFIAPAEERIASAGSTAVGNFVENTNQSYDRMITQAEMSTLDAEDSPQIADYLDPIAQGALQYGLNKEYIDTMKPGTDNGGGVIAEPIRPVEPMGANLEQPQIQIPQTLGSEFLVQEPPQNPMAGLYRMKTPKRR